jgi:hypothetical protein
MPTFDYTVDDKPQTTDQHKLTPNQILSKAEISTTNHYLVQIEGKNRISYQGKGDEEIQMHEHMKFISISFEPTPVSR